MLTYKNGDLHFEDVALRRIGDEVGTPVYAYSSGALKRHYQEFQAALHGLDHMICFAIKANSNQAVLKCIADLGSGFDAVSGGEISRALHAGAPGHKIVFAGVGKTKEELRLALEAKVCQINVESEPEITALNEVAQSLNLHAPIAVRVNPDIDAKTHNKISTGKSENKFGVPISRIRDIYRHASHLSHIKTTGLALHIGSQLTDLAPYRDAFRTACDLFKMLRGEGHPLERLDVGGGLGIPYKSDDTPPSPTEYGALLKEFVADIDCQIIIEPGRHIAGPAGVLLARVLYVKSGSGREFAILDAAMNDLLRPTLYEAYHRITPVSQPSPNEKKRLYDIVGPVCESADTFAIHRPMPIIKPNDLMVIEAAGAYGAVMASEYNTRPLTPEVLIQSDAYSIVRKRPSIDEIIGRDRIPSWL